MREIKINLTMPEWNHLWNLLVRNAEDGIYSGIREQYWNRHRRLVNKLDAAYAAFVMKGKK